MQRRLKPMGKRSKVHKSKMKFIKPNFYDAFHCTAAACSDTCCENKEKVIISRQYVPVLKERLGL